jgi:hypothetical protein
VAYIGTQPLAGQYRKLDDISSGFNGATTSFTTSVGGTNVTAGSPQQLLVSLGGVIQQPTTDYTVNTSTIIFTTAPASGLSFFAILMGDALNTSVPADGSITSAKLAGSLSVGLAAGSASTPSLFFTGDLNTGIYSPGADQVAITTNGVERVEWGTSEVVFNDGGANYDFRIEGDTNSSLFFVDASAEAVGIGTASPSALLHIEQTSPSDGRLARIVSAGVGAGFLGVKSTGNTFIDANTSATALEFRTQDTERARITSDGKLLVGTSSARANFFNSTDTALVQVEGANNNAQRYAGHIYGVAGAGGPWHIFAKHRSNSIGGTTVVIADDQVGALSFQGSDGTEFVEAARIEALVDGTPGSNDMPGRLVFSTTADGASSPTERMRIGQLGYTKISNAASYNNLSGEYHEFNGSAADWTAYVRNTNANPAGLIVRYSGAAPNGTSNEFLYCSDTGVLRLAVRSNGGIANYSGNDANLCDEREKKNIVNLDSTWDCLKHWELKKFHYNEDADTDDLRYGVIAQQIADYCPEVITDWVKQKAEPAKLDEDGTEIEPAKEEIARLGVKEQQMMWMAIKALQEAQLRIETLEAEVAALKAS